MRKMENKIVLIVGIVIIINMIIFSIPIVSTSFHAEIGDEIYFEDVNIFK